MSKTVTSLFAAPMLSLLTLSALGCATNGSNEDPTVDDQTEETTEALAAPCGKLSSGERINIFTSVVSCENNFKLIVQTNGALVIRSGSINIASTGGKQGVALASPYSAAKHGVVGFTKAVGLELAQKGITVNAICPGYVETPMAQRVRQLAEEDPWPPRPFAHKSTLR